MSERNEDESRLLRQELTPDQRTARMRFAIDPGFVNHRLIETVLGPRGTEVINHQIAAIPAGVPGWARETQIGHVYTRTLVAFCEINRIPPLGAMLSERRGSLFCSTEQFEPAPEIYDQVRAMSVLRRPEFEGLRAELHYTTARVTSDTVRSRLHDGAELSVVGLRRSTTGDLLVFEPLVIGSPWLTNDDEDVAFDDPEWWGHSYGQVFVEDIDELARAGTVEPPDDFSPMRTVSERAFKQCLAELLHESAPKDWGGEQSDLVSGRIHLRGRRTTAAFLLKGPARFSPMTFRHLGTNGDQIYRLSQEPAELLVVQHCHEITSAVHATLRQFTIMPGSVRRRYCLLDGRESLRILLAYDKLARAIELSAD